MTVNYFNKTYSTVDVWSPKLKERWRKEKILRDKDDRDLLMSICKIVREEIDRDDLSTLCDELVGRLQATGFIPNKTKWGEKDE